MEEGFAKIVDSVGYSMKGLRHAFHKDKSFRLEIVWGFPMYFILWCVLSPLTAMEFVLYLSSYLFILIVELLNTSMEIMLDRLHPEKHELIGHSKDIASAAVLLSFIFALVVVSAIYISRVTRG